MFYSKDIWVGKRVKILAPWANGRDLRVFISEVPVVYIDPKKKFFSVEYEFESFDSTGTKIINKYRTSVPMIDSDKMIDVFKKQHQIRKDYNDD